MPLRSVQFAPGERYHICTRGNNKQKIFRTEQDYRRFLFLLIYFQSPVIIPNVSRYITTHSDLWKPEQSLLAKILAERFVSLEAFALMPNHIHIAICEKQEQGTAMYLHRVLTAYAKYINTRYETVGHLFQGPYRAVHIADNDQLLYLSTYIHRNPCELPGVRGKEHKYQWSSYQDYLGENRFGKLLDTSLLLDQFRTTQEYRTFVDSSLAKENTTDMDLFS